MNIIHRAVTVLSVAAATLAAAAITAAGTTGATDAAGHAGVAARVPASFTPAAASFRSPGRGVVLGGVGCQRGEPCRARLVATTDGGAHWRFLATPGVWLASHRHLVSQAVFPSGRNGWLYRPGGHRLWATHDGGRHWRKLALGGTVEALAASREAGYAVVAPSDHTGWQLWRSPAGRDAWSRAGRMTATHGQLAVWDTAAWFGNSRHLWATVDGTRWHRYPFRCPKRYSLNGLNSIAAASPTRVVFLCLGDAAAGSQGKAVLRSVDGGKTLHRAGTGPFGGSGGVLAVPPHHVRVISLGTSFSLYLSADGGKTWTTTFFESGGVSWNYLAYVSRTVGWAQFGAPPYGGELLRTADAGVTWQQVTF
jgi:hypothetical protein